MRRNLQLNTTILNYLPLGKTEFTMVMHDSFMIDIFVITIITSLKRDYMIIIKSNCNTESLVQDKIWMIK